MFGWINDCTEKLVVSKFGIEKWHEIKKKAGCSVDDGGFVRHKYYPDQSTVSLVVAASEILGLPVDGVLEAFGQFFMEFVRQEGYENLLSCQGSTLRLWLSNLNALHDHLESSLPKGMVAPVFWCEDDDEANGSILLHYYSKRGSLLVPLVVGVVKEVARYHFDVEIEMDRLDTQGEEGSRCSTWRISSVDPSQQWKLTQGSPAASPVGTCATPPTGNTKQSVGQGRCPFSGSSIRDCDDVSTQHLVQAIDNIRKRKEMDSRPFRNEPSKAQIKEEQEVEHAQEGEEKKTDVGDALRDKLTSSSSFRSCSICLSGDQMKQIFPYHVVVNEAFVILQVGDLLPPFIKRKHSCLLGQNISDVLEISRPVLSGWNWPTLNKLEDQTFFMKPSGSQATHSTADGDTNGENAKSVLGIKLKGNMINISHSPLRVMFVLSPDVKNVFELTNMGLTMSDLPLHSFQRDAVFLGEHIASEVRSAHMLDKLSKKLKNEKNLSNALLYSMIPRETADILRAGKPVEPVHHENVTLFFSDIVGFTSICDEIPPWDVIDMLNRLYSVMDFVADKFKLYKVETIGDAYMCCSGLPTPDPQHAENVANFAVAVQLCVKHVISPLDGQPLRLRIGIHTGSCMAGVVGTLTPRYSLFGDMINTTARHESTGEPGRIQCSSILYGRLKHYSDHASEQFNFLPRGLVDMKGKGRMFTYWLEGGTDENVHVNTTALQNLYSEVGNMLAKKKWKKRTYFRRRNTMTSMSSDIMEFAFNDSVVGSTEFVEEGVARRMSMELHARRMSMEHHKRRGSGDHSVVSVMTDAPETDAVPAAPARPQTWADTKWNPDYTREDLVHSCNELLMDLLSRCMTRKDKPDDDDEDIAVAADMNVYINRISLLYHQKNSFHNWQHACHVLLSTDFLMSRWEEAQANPALHFTAVFAALVHDVEHVGVPNAQLKKEKHILCDQYADGSYLERHSMNVALKVLIEDFPRLYTRIMTVFPAFPRVLHGVVLATDISSKELQQGYIARFEEAMKSKSTLADEDYLARMEPILTQLIQLADVSHCSQNFQTFLLWNEAFYRECFEGHQASRGFDPRENWYDGQIWFLENYVQPLAERCEQVIPNEGGRCSLQNGVQQNLLRWKQEGRAWSNHFIQSYDSPERT